MVVIRLMRECERETAASLVVDSMRTHYSCEPHPLPETVFVAVHGRVIVGVIALAFRDCMPLPIEIIYALDDAVFPSSFDWVHTAQIGRWVALVPRIGEVLFYAAMRHAALRGCRWGIGEVKPKVRRRFLQMGIATTELSATPRLERIPVRVLPYYFSLPPPVPCLIVLDDAIRALEQRRERFLARGGKIEFSP